VRTSSLFRSEAVAHLSENTYGVVILSRSLPTLILSIFFGLIAGLILIGLIFFNYTRKVQVNGSVVAIGGAIGVQSQQRGVITESFIFEGQAVKQGDILFTVESEKVSHNGETIEKNIQNQLNLRKQSFITEINNQNIQSKNKTKALSARMNVLKENAKRLDEQITLQEEKIGMAQELLMKYEELKSSNFISQNQVLTQKSDLINQRQKYSELKQSLTTNARDLINTKMELQDIQVQSKRDVEYLTRNLAEISKELIESDSRRRLQIKAPIDGTVGALLVDVGQSVSTDAELAILIKKDAKFEVELIVDSASIGFIREGQQIMIRYKSFPYQKFGQYSGSVAAVTSVSIRSNLIDKQRQAIGLAASDFGYRVRAKLDSQNILGANGNYPLRTGMSVEATIMLETRRLYEWALSPFLSAAVI